MKKIFYLILVMLIAGSTAFAQGISFKIDNIGIGDDPEGMILTWEIVPANIDIDNTVVERSFNGTNFETVGEGIDAGTGAYKFMDAGTYSKNIYYRITAHAKNGMDHTTPVLHFDMGKIKVIEEGGNGGGNGPSLDPFFGSVAAPSKTVWTQPSINVYNFNYPNMSNRD